MSRMECEALVELSVLAEERGELLSKVLESCYKLGVKVYYEYEDDEMWVNIKHFMSALAPVK